MLRGKLHFLYKLIAATSVMISLLALFIAGVLFSARQAPPPDIEVELPTYYQLGQILPTDVPCMSYRYYASSTAGCIENGPTGIRYSVIYRNSDRVIVHGALWHCDCTISLGDLLVLWGEPTGATKTAIYWGKRSAFTFERPGLSPYSPVFYISYDEQPEETRPWRGFVTH